MEDANVLCLLSATMFIGSYLAGFVPLAISFSESKIRYLSILGAGLLVGTALAVILPEGIEALQSSSALAQQNLHHSISSQVKDSVHAAETLMEGANNADGSDDNPPRIVPKDAIVNPDVPMDVDAHGDDKETNKSRQKRDTVNSAAEIVQPQEENEQELVRRPRESHDHASAHNFGPQIGYSLITGFLLMLFVDQFTKRRQASRQKLTATVGLVVHAAVDGIALGSASLVSKSDIQLIVFVAIMLHKAPAAFGLVSILLMEGLERSKVKKHLIVFSASAPLAALVTYFLLPKGDTITSSTGILLLFSAGTFLYVATVHVLPELAAGRSHHDHIPVQTNASSGHSSADFTLTELLVFVVGALFPAVLASGHHH